MRSILFTIYGIPIHSYGLMMAIGFSLGLWRAAKVGEKRGISADKISNLALIVLISGVIGSRIVFIILNPSTENWSSFLAVWQGGLSFHGGVIFGILAAYIYAHIAKIPLAQSLDLLAPSVAIGYAFTRIGCFLNGCCYGAPCSLPWAVRFNENGVLTPPSHPTQIYASIASLLIFFILTRLEKLRRAPGFISASYIGLYGIYRFLIEFLRKGYTAEVWNYGLTQAQAVSLLMIALAAVIVVLLYKRPAKKVISQ